MCSVALNLQENNHEKALLQLVMLTVALVRFGQEEGIFYATMQMSNMGLQRNVGLRYNSLFPQPWKHVERVPLQQSPT